MKKGDVFIRIKDGNKMIPRGKSFSVISDVFTHKGKPAVRISIISKHNSEPAIMFVSSLYNEAYYLGSHDNSPTDYYKNDDAMLASLLKGG